MNADMKISFAAKAALLTLGTFLTTIVFVGIFFGHLIDKDSKGALYTLTILMLFLVPGAVYMILETHKKRFKKWQCRGCGYDLRHSESEKCSECGRKLSPAQKLTLRHQAGID
ncbi:MAG: hypothetical protein KTR15_01520 [Phycisphaeraceae bacterium]|nr:hypothetical protein [Phycisphaeraceae bacterium]